MMQPIERGVALALSDVKHVRSLTNGDDFPCTGSFQQQRMERRSINITKAIIKHAKTQG
jgi:hypothetical protein